MATYAIFISGYRLWGASNLNLALTSSLELVLQLVISASVSWLINWPVFSVFFFSQTLLVYLAFLVSVRPYA